MNNIDKLVEEMLESYEQHTIISNVNAENQLNKAVILDLMGKLQQLAYPGYFEMKHVRKDTLKYHVGDLMEHVSFHLKKQMEKVMEGDVALVVQRFWEQFPRIRAVLATDIQAGYDGDPAAYSTDEVVLSYPGVYAISINRIAHALFELGVPLIPRMMTEQAHSQTGIDIHPGATIGEYFFIDHGTGVVIGGTTVIGKHVKVYQGVTLGAISTRGGQKLRGVKRHPTIEDNVTVYSGASILGGETVVGKGAVIGSNAFVTTSVPAGTRVSWHKCK